MLRKPENITDGVQFYLIHAVHGSLGYIFQIFKKYTFANISERLLQLAYAQHDIINVIIECYH